MTRKTWPIRLQLPTWARPTHPIYRLETQRQTSNRGLTTLQLAFLPALFGITELALLGSMSFMVPLMFNPSLDSFTNVGLAVILIVVSMIQVGAGALGNVLVIAQTAPAISGEIELQSWRLLRTTTLPLHEIVLAKFSAALAHLRLMLGGLMILRVITTVTAVLLFTLVLARQTVYASGPVDGALFFSRFRWLPLMLPLVAVTVTYLSQPVVQFCLNGALGMLASAYTRTRAQAIAAAFMSRLGLWAVTVLVNIGAYSGLTIAFSNWAQPQYASIESFRVLQTPPPEVVTWTICIVISGYAISILAGQIGLALFSLGLVLRRARQLGV
jgi:hypothetical protein